MERQSAAAAGEVIALARKMELAENSGSDSHAEYKSRSREIMKSLAGLDASQVGSVIAAVRDSDEISDGLRGDIIGFSVMALADTDPGETIRLFTEWPESAG